MADLHNLIAQEGMDPANSTGSQQADEGQEVQADQADQAQEVPHDKVELEVKILFDVDNIFYYGKVLKWPFSKNMKPMLFTKGPHSTLPTAWCNTAPLSTRGITHGQSTE